MIAAAILAGLTLALALALLRLFAGPTLYDRAQAMSLGIVLTTLMAAAIAVAANRPDWIDICFALALGLTLLQAAVLKFFRARTFQPPLAADEAAS